MYSRMYKMYRNILECLFILPIAKHSRMWYDIRELRDKAKTKSLKVYKIEYLLSDNGVN